MIMKKMTATLTGIAIAATIGAAGALPAQAAVPSQVAVMAAVAPEDVAPDLVKNQARIIDLYNKINAYRADNGLPPFKFNVHASNTATEWSGIMAANQDFKHDNRTDTSPLKGLWSVRSENIAAVWSGDVNELFVAWKNSPSHNAAMLSTQTDSIGIGLHITGNKDWAGQPKNYYMYGTTVFHKPFDDNLPLSYRSASDFFNGAEPLPTIENTVTLVTPTKPGSNFNASQYTIPTQKGVDYYVGTVKKAAGTYTTSDTSVVITAKAQSGYRLSGTTAWTIQLAGANNMVTPLSPSFYKDSAGYYIPTSKGVDYYANGVLKAAGSHYVSWGTTVKITVKAKSGYKLETSPSWSKTFTQATVAAPAPTFKSGTSNASYTIPSKTGVYYTVNGKQVKAGTHTFALGTTVEIVAKAAPGYKLSGTQSWTKYYSKPTPSVKTVATKAPSFNTSTGKYSIPSVTGIQYYANGKAVNAGTYNSGWKKITVTAKAKSGYKLSGTTSWSKTFVKTVSTKAPSFNTSNGKYWIPNVTGIQYYANGKAVKSATYSSGWKKITVTAKAKSGYKLSGTTSWSKTFVRPANPSIKSTGDIVAIDSRGALWNYGKSGSGKTRVKIGSSGWTAMSSINIADWNKDGYVDIIAKAKKGQLYYYKASKYGGFKRYTIGSSGWGSYDVDVAKWKKTDKYPSLIAKHRSNGKLYVYPNKSGYKLSSRSQVGSGWKSLELTFVDWDNDGKMDVVAKNPSGSGKLVLYRTNGAGKFVSEKRKVIGNGGWDPYTIVSANGLGGKSTDGIIAKHSSGKLYYYQANKNKWAPRKYIGSGWKSYNIAGQG